MSSSYFVEYCMFSVDISTDHYSTYLRKNIVNDNKLARNSILLQYLYVLLYGKKKERNYYHETENYRFGGKIIPDYNNNWSTVTTVI